MDDDTPGPDPGREAGDDPNDPADPTGRDASGGAAGPDEEGDAATGPSATDAPEEPDGADEAVDAGGVDDAGEAADAAGAESADGARDPASDESDDVPPDVATYARFKKMDGAQYERVNDFLRERTYITAREWAIARLCADFRTETGVEMTKIGENLPHLVPFMTDTYTPQAVNQARSAFEEKVRKAGATFLYGAMSDLLTADELDDVMYEATEVAKFLLEVEGVDLTVEEELEAEERISSVMRDVRTASDELRHEGVKCPHCGETFDPENPEAHVEEASTDD